MDLALERSSIGQGAEVVAWKVSDVVFFGGVLHGNNASGHYLWSTPRILL
jgi:hypothetical protein